MRVASDYSLSDAFVLQCENAIRFGEYSLTEVRASSPTCPSELC